MAQTNKQTNKVLLLLTFLLLNGIIVSCDSCKSEKEKLEQEEKALMGKLKKQISSEYWEKKLEPEIKKNKHDNACFLIPRNWLILFHFVYCL